MAEQATPSRTITTWNIDPAHTQVNFAVKHMMISTVKGSFGDVNGTIKTDESDPNSGSAEVTIGVASIDTRQAQRDGHLRSGDFLDAEKYPTITFRSRRVQALGDDRYQIVGDLTIRDITREVALQVTSEGQGKDPWGNERAAFSATTTVDRRDWGLTWNQGLETGGVLVGNDIKVSIDLEAVKQK